MANGGFHVDLASSRWTTLRSSDQFTVVDGILATTATTSSSSWPRPPTDAGGSVVSDSPTAYRPRSPSAARHRSWHPSAESRAPTCGVQRSRIATRRNSPDRRCPHREWGSRLALPPARCNRPASSRRPPGSEPDPNHRLVASQLDARLDMVGFAVDLAGLGAVPSDIMTTSLQVEPGEALTFLVPLGDDGLDVTLRGLTGGWRLRRLVPIGDITAAIRSSSAERLAGDQRVAHDRLDMTGAGTGRRQSIAPVRTAPKCGIAGERRRVTTDQDEPRAQPTRHCPPRPSPPDRRR